MTMQRLEPLTTEVNGRFTFDSSDPPAQRYRRPSDDPFFEAGDRVALRNGFDGNGLVAIFCLTEEEDDQVSNIHHRTVAPMLPVTDDDEPYENEPQPMTENRFTGNRGYPCVVCHKGFATLLECEAHHEEEHVHQCHACHSVLPNGRLLDLHLMEVHDAYFAANVRKGRVGYSCLEQDCSPSGFPNDLERHQHLMQKHGYPKWFRFLSRRKRKDQEGDEELRKKRTKWMMQHLNNEAGPPSQRDDDMMETATREKKVRRKQRKFQKRSQTPCKFYGSKGGCWRGSSCMFLHEGSSPAGEDSMDAVDEMTTKLSKVSLVPNAVRFGRAKRR